MAENLDGISPSVVSEHMRGNGGGIFDLQGSIQMLGEASGCTIEENTSENSGGGIYINEGMIYLSFLDENPKL